MDHATQLGKRKLYRVSSQSLNWFRCYLSDQKQQTYIDEVQSDFCNLTCFSPHVRESMTVLDSAFHPVDSGFRVLDSGFQLSRFRIPKRAGFQTFFFFNTFRRISFSCSNLTILKDVVFDA